MNTSISRFKIFGGAAALAFVFALLGATYPGHVLCAQNRDLDARVQRFLETHDWGWGDMNVPAVDGRTLHDIIVENNYTRALEIGTSTGHSGTWIAWALSKTGGKLITIDIDEQRHREALENFAAAGLSDFIEGGKVRAPGLPLRAPAFDCVVEQHVTMDARVLHNEQCSMWVEQVSKSFGQNIHYSCIHQLSW